MSLESGIQNRVRDRLKKAGWVVDKPVHRSHDGFPDITAYRAPGYTIFIETKKPGESLSDTQEYWNEKLTKMGFECYVIDSVSQLKKFELI